MIDTPWNLSYLIVGLMAYWIICGIGAAAIADSKGRNAGAWFFYGILCGPLGILIVGFMEKEAQPQPAPWERKAVPTPVSSEANRIKCPFCAEMILKEAKICHFCRSEVPQPKPAEPAGAPPQGVEDQLREGHYLLHMGKGKEAVAVYLAITRVHPDYLPAWRCIVGMTSADQPTKDLARQNIERLTALA